MKITTLLSIFCLCLTSTSNADVYREWESKKSNKIITAKVVDKHLDKDVWKCHLVVKDTKKGYWINIDDLSDVDKDYLSKWIVFEDRITVVDGEHLTTYYANKDLMYIFVAKSREAQTVKVIGRMGSDAEVFEIPAYDENFEEDTQQNRIEADTKTKESVCSFNKRIVKTIRIELYSADGSLISKWRHE